MEVVSPAGDRPQQQEEPDLEHETRLKPCGEMGAGEHLGASPVGPGAPRGPHPTGEHGDCATAVGEGSRSGSTTPEYLTPAGSLFSLEFFCSTMEVFPSEQQPVAVESKSLLPATSDQREQEATCLDIASPSPSPDEEELPTARIVDVPGQRVDFRNTPSTLSLLSQGCRNLADDGSSGDASSSEVRSSSSEHHHDASDIHGWPFLYASPSSEVSGSSPAPHSNEPSSVQSAIDLVQQLEGDQLATHVKQPRQGRRFRQLWVSLWTGLRRRFQQWTVVRRRRKQRGQVGSLLQPRPHKTTQGNWEDDDDNISSDEFYTAGPRWSARRLYQRFVSYLHAVAVRRGS